MCIDKYNPEIIFWTGRWCIQWRRIALDRVIVMPEKSRAGRKPLDENKKRKMLSTRISPETQKRIKDVAAARSISIGGWIDLMVKRDIETLGLSFDEDK